MHQVPGASCGILYYPGLVSCPFYAIPIIPFLIYEIFHLLVILYIIHIILYRQRGPDVRLGGSRSPNYTALHLLRRRFCMHFSGVNFHYHSIRQGQEKQCGDFAETTAFERYGVKTSEKANMHNEHWLTSTRFSPFSAPWTN